MPLTFERFSSSILPGGPRRHSPLALCAAAVALAGGLALAQGAAAEAPATIGGQAVVEVSAGAAHSCARVANGLVWCWGANTRGQLGNDSTDRSLVPVQVQGLRDIVRISAGDEHSCAVRRDGAAFCWGSNGAGQLGNGTTADRTVPVRVARLQDIRQIAAGHDHSCALRDNGRVFCWGGNSQGQLGTNDRENRLRPVRVSGVVATRAEEIGAGHMLSCLRNTAGRVFCWGSNRWNELGTPVGSRSLVPVRVTRLGQVTALSVGDYHSCAVRGDANRVWCWGYNSYGALGDGTTEARQTPVAVRGLSGVAQVAAGGYWGTSCAVQRNGRTFCWGSNDSGQLGIDSTERFVATRARLGSMNNGAQLSVGLYHVCGQRRNGTAWCWGFNSSGQLGDGTIESRRVPVRVRDN